MATIVCTSDALRNATSGSSFPDCISSRSSLTSSRRPRYFLSSPPQFVAGTKNSVEESIGEEKEIGSEWRTGCWRRRRRGRGRRCGLRQPGSSSSISLRRAAAAAVEPYSCRSRGRYIFSYWRKCPSCSFGFEIRAGVGSWPQERFFFLFPSESEARWGGGDKAARSPPPRPRMQLPAMSCSPSQSSAAAAAAAYGCCQRILLASTSLPATGRPARLGLKLRSTHSLQLRFLVLVGLACLYISISIVLGVVVTVLYAGSGTEGLSARQWLRLSPTATAMATR